MLKCSLWCDHALSFPPLEPTKAYTPGAFVIYKRKSKRFEQKGEISFCSLIKIAIALDCENDNKQKVGQRNC